MQTFLTVLIGLAGNLTHPTAKNDYGNFLSSDWAWSRFAKKLIVPISQLRANAKTTCREESLTFHCKHATFKDYGRRTKLQGELDLLAFHRSHGR
jgi:hypothetical protein